MVQGVSQMRRLGSTVITEFCCVIQSISYYYKMKAAPLHPHNPLTTYCHISLVSHTTKGKLT